MGSAAKKVGSTVGKVASVVAPVTYLANKAIALGGIKAVGGKTPQNGFLGGLTTGGLGGNLGLPANPGTKYGDLNILMDPVGDRAAIEGEGQRQSNQNAALIARNAGTFGQDQAAIDQEANRLGSESNDAIDKGVADRTARRAQLAQLLGEQARNTFAQTLPKTAEDYNAGGLLNSTGYQQEVARQQGLLASDVDNKLAQQGLADIDYSTSARAAALGQQQDLQKQALASQLAGTDYGRNAAATSLAQQQGFQNQGLSRQFSLEDYAREANVAKQIGAQVAPTTKGGKGTGVTNAFSLAGAGAKAGSNLGPHGAAAGGIAGGIAGLLGGGK